MDGFQYTHGDRPLEGFTIQRAVGRGGFGEVYYALSDAGREVALKVIHGYEQIEVRGVSQCMNLKSPHLVSIFDIKQNAQGKTFVIMEYVNGPCLKELLEQSPAGLGAAKSAFFLRELAKGLAFLHERGIVHRDLKPGNIFYEDGYVKIGDYGLSKAIGVSLHSGQTITVGTVQYMAPEVGMGKYDRSIDIYALGIVFYEMLTGQVPFFGSSHGEILMKHMMAQPDLTGIEEPFATVIRKAMAKDPAERYQSVQEMVEAVFGAEHVRNSVSCFSPDSLTMVAGRVAQKVTVGAETNGGSSAANDGGYGTYKPPVSDDSSDVWGRVAQRMDEARKRFQERGGQLRLKYKSRRSRFYPVDANPDSSPVAADPGRDPLNSRQRRTLAAMTTAAVAIGTALLSEPGFGWLAALGVALTAIALIWSHRRFGASLDEKDGFVQRVAYNGAAVLAFSVSALFWLPMLAHSHVRWWDQTVYCTILGLAIVDWRSRLLPGREDRISLTRAFLAGLTGWVFIFFLDGNPVAAAAIPAGISLTVQALAAFDPTARRRGTRLNPTPPAGSPAGDAGGQMPPHSAADPSNAGDAAAFQAAGFQATREDVVRPPPRRLPRWLRPVLLGLFVALLGTGILLLVAAGVVRMRDEEMAAMICLGIGSLVMGIFAFVRAMKTTYRSYWSGLVRPVLMLLLLLTGFTAAMFLGNSRYLRDEEVVAGAAFIIFPGLLLFVLMFISDRTVATMIRGSQPPAREEPAPQGAVSDRDAFVAMMLACAGFVGLGGLHRFYAGKPLTGVLWLLTFGGFMVGTIVDIVTICSGVFRDGRGLPLQIWLGTQRARPLTTDPVPLSKWPLVGQVAPAPPLDQPVGQVAPDQVERYPAGAPIFRRPESLYAPRLTNRWLSALGTLVLLAAAVLGVILSFNLPGLVKAGFPDPSMGRELNHMFGYTEWPRLLTRIGEFVAVALGVVGTAMLLIARRKAGAAHSGRVIFGAIAILLAMSTLSEACYRIDWFTIVPLFKANQAGPAIDDLLERIRIQFAIASGLLLLASVFILAWPEHRERLDARSTEGSAS